jgi:hypothetical protein
MLTLTATFAASIWTCFSAFNQPKVCFGGPFYDYLEVSRIKKAHSITRMGFRKMAATYSPGSTSTIGANVLNFSVRNGKR